SEIKLNEFATGAQWHPALAGTGGDAFFAVWQSYGQDGSGDAVAARRLNLPTPQPAPQISIHETSGTTDDNFITFGTRSPNSASPTQTLRITNTGHANLSGNLSVAGDAAVFAISGSLSFNLAPGAFRDVVVTMSTAHRGVYAAEIVIQHNADSPELRVGLNGDIAPTADSYESNNQIATASNLGVLPSIAPVPQAVTLSGLTLHSDSDVDWFRIQVPVDSFVTVAATFDAAEGDIDLGAYDASLGVLASSSTLSDAESMTFRLAAGEVAYIEVASYGPGRNVYDLSFTASPVIVIPPLGQLSMTVDWGDGTTEAGTLVAGSGGGTLANTHRYADNGQYTVVLTLSDGTTTVSSQSHVSVANVGPSMGALTGPTAAVRGQSLNYSVAFADAGLSDTHTALIDWGDGTTSVGSISELNGAGSVSGSHTYKSPRPTGSYQIQVTVRDDDSATATASQNVAISAVLMETNPNDATKTDLVIGGTTFGDTIVLAAATGGIKVTVNGVVMGNTFNPTARIVVFGQDGNDT
ncbi:MAG: PKD domain-containing protein, partial [Planctomycetota bacterium]|nr:PKD domain-containing protein [Planctomycetota bacterium]